MIIPTIKVIFFFIFCFIFGICFLYKIKKEKSILNLVTFSLSFGISAYVVICHIMSYFIGPKMASAGSLFLITLLSLIIVIFSLKEKFKLELIFEKKQVLALILISVFISLITFKSAHGYGIFDEIWHIPLAKSLFQNNIYPPRDFLRPDYPLAYHFGGDLLAGAIYTLCKTSIFTSFEIIGGVFSGITFLSFFCIAWLISKNFKISLLTAFCSYFGAGFTLINELIKTLFNKFTEQTIVNLLVNGVHGKIIDAPSILSFSSSACLGYPILLFCYFIFFNLESKNKRKDILIDSFALFISLFSLTLIAGWLAATFLASAAIYTVMSLIIRRKSYLKPFISFWSLFLAIITINILAGNLMYSTEELIGRANIFNLELKQNPFTLSIWSGNTYGMALTKIISCFDFEFISNFGLSLILLPVTIFCLFKQKNKFLFLLLLSCVVTFPIPLLLDFKLNKVDINRIFLFGNSILIFLTTITISQQFKSFLKSKLLISIYLFLLCLSPASGFLLGALFSPQIYLHDSFIKYAIKEFKNASSALDYPTIIAGINKYAIKQKSYKFDKFENEISFFSKNSKSGEVAISTIPPIPAFSGVYSLVPAHEFGLKDQIYTQFDTLYPILISTFDPYLLKEFNVRWIGIDEKSKAIILKENTNFTDNKNFFTLKYKKLIEDKKNKKNYMYEIYKVKELTNSDISKFERKIGWILVNEEGFPIEIKENLNKQISVFDTEKNSLIYLKQLLNQYQWLKKKSIIAQPTIIKVTMQQLKENNLNIPLEFKF